MSLVSKQLNKIIIAFEFEESVLEQNAVTSVLVTVLQQTCNLH